MKDTTVLCYMTYLSDSWMLDQPEILGFGCFVCFNYGLLKQKQLEVEKKVQEIGHHTYPSSWPPNPTHDLSIQTSLRLWELPDRAHAFFWLSYSRILLFSFNFPLFQGALPISWCPEISLYVARHFVLIFFNEFSSVPTHPLTTDLYAQEKTRRDVDVFG